MTNSKLLRGTFTLLLTLVLALVSAGCGEGSSESTVGGGGAPGGSGGMAGGGSGGDDGGHAGDGGSGGLGGGPICRIFDLEASGAACQSCVGEAVTGSCQVPVMSCLQMNPDVIDCGTDGGCLRLGESPPIDLVCLASACAVELLQLNGCLMKCEAYAACFL